MHYPLIELLSGRRDRRRCIIHEGHQLQCFEMERRNRERMKQREERFTGARRSGLIKFTCDMREGGEGRARKRDTRGAEVKCFQSTLKSYTKSLCFKWVLS